MSQRDDTFDLKQQHEDIKMVNKSHDIHNGTKNTEISFPAEIKDIFPDTDLAERVANELGKNVNDKVTQDELLAVKELILYTSNTEGIQYLKGLEALGCSDIRYLSGKPISDITFLEGLTKLHSLNLDDNDISDITSLGKLSNLTKLRLANNKIGNVSALKNLTNLEILDLSNVNTTENEIEFIGSNHVSDLSPLNNLKNLRGLHLDMNRIGDFSLIKSLPIENERFSGENQSIELPKTPERQHHLILRNKDGSDVKIEPGSTGHYNNDTVYWNNQGENKLIFSGENISGVVREITT